MRKPKERIKLNKKYSSMGQYGESEDNNSFGEFETIGNQYKKYSKSIGMFIISFSNMEDSVDRDLANAIYDRSNEPGYRIIKYLSFRDKINLLRDDYFAFIKGIHSKNKQKKLLDELKIIHSKLAELSEFRNRVVHANWSSLDKNGFIRCKIFENQEDPGLVFEKVKMTPGVLIKFIRQNNSIANKLSDFREKVWEVYRQDEINKN